MWIAVIWMSGALGVGEVGEQSPGCLNRHPLLRQPEPIKRLHRKMAATAFPLPAPPSRARNRAADCQTRRQPLLGRRTIRVIVACGKDDFDGAEPLHFTPAAACTSSGDPATSCVAANSPVERSA